jgi:hypothetical protein
MSNAAILEQLTLTASLVRRTVIGDAYSLTASHPEGGSVTVEAWHHRHGDWVIGRVDGDAPSEVLSALGAYVAAGSVAEVVR